MNERKKMYEKRTSLQLKVGKRGPRVLPEPCDRAHYYYMTPHNGYQYSAQSLVEFYTLGDCECLELESELLHYPLMCLSLVCNPDLSCILTLDYSYHDYFTEFNNIIEFFS